MDIVLNKFGACDFADYKDFVSRAFKDFDGLPGEILELVW